MNRLLIPNTTQVPNALIEDVMPNLSGSALKLLLVIVRKTYGFQKYADKISFSTLQRLSGLSRDAVNRGIKELGAIISIKAGVKNCPNILGINEYSLNLNVETGELVRKTDQSENRTSQKNRKKLVRKSDSSKPNSSKPIGASKRHPRNIETDPRVKTLLTAFVEKYQARVGAAYVVVAGKDPALLKRLLSAGHDLPTVQTVMARYFADNFYGKTGFDVGGFAKAFNRLISAGTKRRPNYDDGAFPSL